MNEGLEALKYARIVDYTTDVALGKREPNKKLEESFNIIEKDLKALEIIKNKCSPLLKQYLLDLLPKEESDLLKKVLNNEKEIELDREVEL